MVRAVDQAVVVAQRDAQMEVVLVFAGTMVRTFLHSSELMGIDEPVPYSFRDAGFLGGALAFSCATSPYGAVDRAPRAWNEVFKAITEWVVIVVSLLIGGYSIPLLVANVEEKTILPDRLCVMIALITIGSAMPIVRRLFAWRPPVACDLPSLAVGTRVLLFLTSQGYLATHPKALYWVLACSARSSALAIAVGFALAAVGIAWKP
jgi:hypothetical protein